MFACNKLVVLGYLVFLLIFVENNINPRVGGNQAQNGENQRGKKKCVL